MFSSKVGEVLNELVPPDEGGQKAAALDVKARAPYHRSMRAGVESGIVKGMNREHLARTVEWTTWIRCFLPLPQLRRSFC